MVSVIVVLRYLLLAATAAMLALHLCTSALLKRGVRAVTLLRFEIAYYTVLLVSLAFPTFRAVLIPAIVLAGIFFSIYMSRTILRRLDGIIAIIDDLGRGVIRPIVARSVEDEMGKMIASVNHLSENLRATADFAQQVGERNFTARFEPLSCEDNLGKSLVTMRDNLKASEEELLEITDSLNRKDQLLQQNGFLVLRFLAEDVAKDLDAVLDSIQQSLAVRYRQST